ncbi:DUF4192 domain-containing protein [Amycolatopsis keratiniphila]|uniref:DUF4192 domain-containing protein n=1 Tax=Amycolatopsis keratiniphila TaxID=129921 RepID=UPI00087D8EB2|nr:DUF4192 domain-containing protein [Amycolatopsis keratiniphila]OLZ50271.1 hypothetical protein BS330_28805 [Amycolatopsis keratiniphila subsp. nogabecina]SDU66978.1 protein of unknown function [Amycolatopsis keratiniphila]
MARTVKVTTTTDVFAAIPHMLGFVPHSSLVLIFIGNDPRRPNRTELIARSSLDNLDRDPEALAHSLTRRAMDRPIHAAIGLIVCPASSDTDQILPYQTELLALTHAIQQLGIRVSELGHVPGFTEGAPWRSYLDAGRTGVLPDPFATAVAATAVSEGLVTARSRDELAAAFTPAPLADRARLEPQILSALGKAQADRGQPDAARERLARADSAITAAAKGSLPLGDKEIADLIATFSTEPFRSATFSVEPTSLLRAVAALATYLWRFAPEPCASHLAAVAGLHAYMVDGGPTARFAADAGTARLPLLALLRHILDAQLPPHELRTVTEDGAAEARAHLTAPATPPSTP